MNIIEFLDQNKIGWQPLLLEVKAIDGKTRKIPKAFPDYIPKNNDYKIINKDTLNERKLKHTDTEYIAIETHKINQYDQDTKDHVVPDEIMIAPYFESVTKKLPHYFIKIKKTSKQSTPLDGADILTGMWSYCKRDTVVLNYDRPIPKDITISSFDKFVPDITESQLKRLLTKLESRADNYTEWFETIVCIKNVCIENKIDDIKMMTYFSKLSPKFDDESLRVIENLEYREDGLKLGSLKLWSKKGKKKKKEKKVINNRTKDDDYLEWKERFENVSVVFRNSDKLDYIDDYETKTVSLFNVRNILGLHYDIVNEHYVEEGEKVYYADIWVSDINKKSFFKKGFYPPPAKYDETNVYNIWEDFENNKLEFDYTEEEKEIVIKTFTDFVNHAGITHIDLPKYLTYFIADIIQNPGSKPGIIFIILGPEGTWKGTLYKLISGLIGEKYSYETSDSEKVFGRFNAILENKLFVNMNEAKSIDMINNNSHLKSFITEDTMVYEQKGIEKRSGSNFSRMIIPSNEDKGAKASVSDRRNIYIQSYPMEDDVRLAIYDVIDSKKMCYILFQYLKTVEIPYRNMYEWQTNRPITQKHTEIIEHFRNHHDYFLYDVLVNNQPDDEIFYSRDTLYTLYSNYMNDNYRGTMKKNKKHLMSFVIKNDGIENQRKSIDKIRKRGVKVNKIVLEKYLIKNNLIQAEEEDYEEDENLKVFVLPE